MRKAMLFSALILFLSVMSFGQQVSKESSKTNLVEIPVTKAQSDTAVVVFGLVVVPASMYAASQIILHTNPTTSITIAATSGIINAVGMYLMQKIADPKD